MRPLNIAVVGGGLSGLTCATKLLEVLQHAKATVFDMGVRGPGGRASTRRQNGMQFDHGLQFMKLRKGNLKGDDTATNDLRSLLSLWHQAGVATEWHGRFGTIDSTSNVYNPCSRRDSTFGSGGVCGNGADGFCGFLRDGPVWVGTPSNDSLCTSLADLHPGRLSHAWATKVTEVKQGERGSWEVSGLRKAEEGSKEVALGTFDAVILTDAMAGNPGSPGYIRMVAPGLSDMSDRMAAATAAPRLTLMAAFPRGAIRAPFDATCVSNHDALEWLCCDSAKPGRKGDSDGIECWTAVSTEAYALRVLESQPLRVHGEYSPAQPQYMQRVAEEMADAVCSILEQWVPVSPAVATHAAAQRWGSCLYPSQQQSASDGTAQHLMMSAANGRVVATGDWLAGSNAEDVVMHAHETARSLAATLTMDVLE